MSKTPRLVLPLLMSTVVAVAATIAACGSSAASSTSVAVTASKGGVVAAPSGAGTLTIPANALGADTTITLAVSAGTADTVTDVFEFGPTGTTFSTPASLELKADAAKLVSGKSFALAVQEGGTWKAIAGSTYANGKVTGPVAHFSKFTVILVDGNVVITSACADEIASYAKCGGDVIGTWTYADYCFAARILGQDPFQGRCPGFVGTIGLDIAGDFTITATTTQTSEITVTTSNEWTIPLTCLTADSGTFTSCAQIQQSQKLKDGGQAGTCSEVGGNCKCTISESKVQAAQEPKARDFDGGDDYCVKNNKLYISDLEPDGGGALIILNKK